MKPQSIVLVLVLVFLVGGAGCAPDTKPSDSHIASQEATGDVYTCPMHPSVATERPGACPICGMALVKRSTAHEATAAELEHLRAVSLSPTQRVSANVATTVAERSVLTKSIAVVGIVDYAEPLQVSVSARFSGRIEKLHVNSTGMRIARGEDLFELYSPDLISAQQDFLLALSAVSAQAGETRSAQDRLLETSRTRLSLHFGLTEQQTLELEQTKTVRQSATFSAPISGTVIRKMVQEGQYVSEGQELYQLADLSRVWIILDVYEQDVRSLRIGQKVSLASAAYPEEHFTGRIIFIDPVVNPETRSVRVRTEFANTQGKLKPEMFVEASIQVPSQPGIVIPASAVLSTGSGSVVWIQTGDNIFEPRPVTLGPKSSALVLILDGLQEGDRVVTSGGYLIDSESLLRMPGRRAGGRAATHGAQETDGKTRSDSNEVSITIKGTYKPDVVRVRKGRPVILHITRSENAACSEEFVIDQFGIRQKLEAFTTTTIRFTPTEAGVVRFSCGMDMLHGKIIVQ